tara:strand:- start:526 stop:825 length:300 start_codon:yes stop_codon:yes gene_type:complete
LALDFMVVGPCRSTGMGLAPVSFGEIEAWSRLTGARLTGWQVDALSMMSRAYVAQRNKGEGKPPTPPPWSGTSATRKAASDQLEQILDSMAGKQGRAHR